MLGHVVLQVAPQVDLEEVTEVGDVIARSSAHL